MPTSLAERNVRGVRLFAWLWAGAAMLVSLGVVLTSLGSGPLWGGIAHESEARSLWGVLLFPGHALREWPHVLILGLFWLQGLQGPASRADAFKRFGAVLGAAGAFALVMFLWGGIETGFSAVWLDFVQGYAARDLTGWGVHWRFHLLSDLALAGWFFLGGRGCANLRGEAAAFEVSRARVPWLGVCGALLFVAGTLLWGLRGTEELGSPRFVGHQAREVFVHVLITLPILMGYALFLSPRVDVPSKAVLDTATASTRRRPGLRIAFMAAVLLPAWMAWRVMQVDILRYSSDPSRGVWLNLAVHNFEHLLDAVLLVSMTFAAWRVRSKPMSAG